MSEVAIHAATERIRYCHYSLRMEQAYVFWVRRLIRFAQLRHPSAMGATLRLMPSSHISEQHICDVDSAVLEIASA
jgi:hypothetical protein